MTEMPSVTLAFELPIQEVLSSDGRDGWPLLADCWRNAEQLANWCQAQLLRKEPAVRLGQDRLPPPPALKGRRLKGLYGLASEMLRPKDPKSWWYRASQSIAWVCRDVEGHHRRERVEVLLHHSRSVRRYQSYPWPVHGAGWLAAWIAPDGKPWVRLTLPGGQALLRLRCGPEFGRQTALFRQVCRGELPRRQVVIRPQRASPACGRPTVRRSGVDYRALLKMVADVPAATRPGGRVLTVTTDPEAFWVADLDGRRVWVLNNDHYRRAFAWLDAHDRRLTRFAQDAKAERRLCPAKLADLGRARERLCLKHRRRLDSWVKESVAHLVGFARRQHVGELVYDDARRDFIPSFPWAALRLRLGDAMAANSIYVHPAA